MRTVLRWLAATAFVLAAVHAPAAPAQEYPSRPIRFFVGPGPDVLARLIGQKLTEAWGHQVVVDRRPAAGGVVAADTVAKAPPDGYTLLLSTGSYTVSASLYPKLPYDFVKDLAPVSLLASLPFLLVAHPSVPAGNTRELIQLARAHPGQLNYASSGNGTTAHLAGEMLKNMARVSIVHVPYKGTTEGVTDLIGGQVHLMFAIIQSSLPYVKSGKLKALGISSVKPSAAAPGVPSMAESGLPGYEFISWNGVHVPAGTPKPIVTKLHGELIKALAQADVKERMFNLGMEPAGNTPEEFAVLVRNDIAKWGKVIRESGVKAD
jgi:tripartite-type tricarboxylate transporter receptor subunit TctC